MDTRSPVARLTALSTLVPAILVAFIAADAALWTLPRERFMFRAWEAVRWNPLPGAPFMASASYRNDEAHGDLAQIGNHHDVREHRVETFTTDGLGFRNDPAFLDAGPPDTLLLGDSFGAGCGVSDDETLSAVLNAITRHRVYNAAAYMGGVTPERVRSILDRVGMKDGTVLLEFLERRDGDPVPPPPRTQPLTMPFIETLAAKSRVRKVSEGIQNRLRDDSILPNPWGDRAPALALRGGSRMLFLASEIGAKEADAADVRHGEEIADLAKAVMRPGLRVFVLLVPNKFTVHAPLLERDPLPRSAVGKRIRAAASVLEREGVEYVDLTVSLQDAAARALAEGRVVYRFDDTHWNPDGIRVSAAVVAAALARPR